MEFPYVLMVVPSALQTAKSRSGRMYWTSIFSEIPFREQRGDSHENDKPQGGYDIPKISRCNRRRTFLFLDL